MLRPATNLPPFRGVHGCNELNVAVLQRAVEAQAAWLVVPCCIRDGPGAHSQGWATRGSEASEVGKWAPRSKDVGFFMGKLWNIMGKVWENHGKNSADDEFRTRLEAGEPVGMLD